MSVKKSAPDLLDWTITAAPTDDEALEAPAVAPAPLPRAHSAHYQRRFSRWMWMTLGGLALIAILGLLIFSWGAQRRATANVRHTFLAEEEAALIGNTNTLISLTAPGYADWLEARLALARRNVAAPAPALLFNPGPEAGTLISITTFAPDIQQIDLLREFTGPAGETTHFTTTQFYQYQDVWKRTPTPPAFSGEWRQYEGRRLTIIYYERDTELINTLGPALDEILQSACAEWDCADNFNIALQFVERMPDFEPSPTTEAEPAILKLLAYPNTVWLDVKPLNLPAPHIVGTPADEVSYAAYERVVSQQVLLYTAHRFIGNTDSTRNALAYALVARLAARLNLDSPSVVNFNQTTFATNLEALWDLQAAELWDLRAAELWEHPSRRQMVLRDALATLNTLLATQSAETEQELFRGLARHTNPREWLTRSLGMEYADVQAVLAEAGHSALAAQLPVELEPTLALQCASGPQLYFESDNSTRPFISGPFLDAQISGWPWLFTGQHVWSPDGNYLTLTVSGRPALLNRSTQSLTWLNINEHAATFLPRAWVADSILVYLVESKLYFLDVTQPMRQFPVYVAVSDYVLSPDRTRAAVVLEQPDGQGNGQIAVMPATGGPFFNIDFGASPIWTADGSGLTYVQHRQFQVGEVWQTHSIIKRATIVNGVRYTVQEGDSLWSIVANHNTSFGAIWDINQIEGTVIVPGQMLIIPLEAGEAQVVVTRDLFPPRVNIAYFTGSASGEKLAAVSDQYQIFLLNADGGLSSVLLDTAVGNPQRLIPANPNATPQTLSVEASTQFVLPPRFSADGRFLAVIMEEAGVLILNLYSAISGRLVRSEQNVSSFAWSAQGHRLAVASAEGVFTLEDPVLANGQMRVVTHEKCEGVWWRP